MIDRHVSGGDQQTTPPPSLPGDNARTTPDPALAEDAYQALINLHTGGQTMPPDQMTGWQRELALPASNVARGLVSTLGAPGDVVRGVGYLAGQRAQEQLAPDPLTAAGAGPLANRNALMVTPTQGPQIVTPQMLAASPDKPNVPAPSLHNPLDTESLLSYPPIAAVANRPDLQPQTPREKLEAAGAQGVGAAIPMLATGGAAGLPGAARTLAQGAGGGVGGYLGGEAGEAVGGTPGRLIGSVAGGVLGGSMAPGGGGPGRFLPTNMDAETRALAQRAQDLGINVSIGAAGSGKFGHYAESTARRFPFSGYDAYDAQNQTAVNRAIASTFGETADKITPAVLDRAYGRIGPVFENAAQRYDLRLDPRMDTALTDIARRAGEAGLDAGQVDAVRAQVQKLRDIAAQNNGVIPGNQYVNLTKRGESLDLLQGNRSTTSGQLGGQIRDALDESLMRSASPADVAALREARTQYKALKTIEPLTMRADTPGGPSVSTGDISPQLLLTRVRQQYQNAPRAQIGDIPLKDIAQIGQRFLKEPPSSGTSERLSVMELGKGVASLGAGVFGGEHFLGVDPAVSATGLATAALMPRVVGSVMRTPALPQPYNPLMIGAAGAYPGYVAPQNQMGPRRQN